MFDKTFWLLICNWPTVTLAYFYRQIRLELERRAKEANGN